MCMQPQVRYLLKAKENKFNTKNSISLDSNLVRSCLLWPMVAANVGEQSSLVATTISCKPQLLGRNVKPGSGAYQRSDIDDGLAVDGVATRGLGSQEGVDMQGPCLVCNHHELYILLCASRDLLKLTCHVGCICAYLTACSAEVPGLSHLQSCRLIKQDGLSQTVNSIW